VNRVERLPDELVNQIAAGEVVERPASVVKELVENAFDAGAGTVAVEIDAGGKALVRVRDDGSGMARDDARLALERHATSKLRALSDLQSIATHGFRGEALPSIASVSQLVLTTRDEASEAGTRIEVRHGRLVGVQDAGHPRGTTVEVRDLFGAVPARRKFLRADATEAAHVSEAVALLALARPAIGLRLVSGGRPLLQAPPVDGLRARLFQLYGARLLEDLAPVEGGQAWALVRGFVGRPDRAGTARAVQRLFVNGRAVRDRLLSKAVAEACRAAGGVERRLEAFLFLEVPPHLLDVNVHPAKTEVRFAEPATVFRAVELAVRDALSEAARASAPAVQVSHVRETAESYGGAWAPTLSSGATPSAGLARPESRQAAWLDAGDWSVLGQHRNTYIVASDGDALLLLDQHTAHERVRFEQLVARLEAHAPESQLLLAPLVVELEAQLLPVLQAHRETLAEVGFDVESFGGGSVRLRAVPALLAGHDLGLRLRSLLRDLLERDSAEWVVAGNRDRLAATLACHSSARAGEPLSREAMVRIARDLAQARHPTQCPHGRPTQVRVPREEVSRWFGRAGWRRQ